MDKEQLELYTDYLLSMFGYAPATGLSAMVNGQVSHDQVTRFPSGGEYTLKQNAALGKVPVRRVVTQNNHIFAILYTFFKLEHLKIKRHINHFALRSHLHLKAICMAYEELRVLKAA